MSFIRKHLFAYITIVAAVLFSTLFCASLYHSAVMVDSTAGALRTTVVIDAGHGGEDGGARSPDGVRESTINLEIALRLDELLHLLGCSTRMTRTEDVSLHSGDAATIASRKVSDLRNRVKLVEETVGALLVSIHQNMFSESKYAGLQVFYAETPGSQVLAESVQTLAGTALDKTNHRAAKPAESIYLLSEISCTGILVECGFLSNQEECGKLQLPEYQKQIALVIADGIQDYLRKANTNEI